MSHAPSRYNLLAADPASLAALLGPFNDGDSASVITLAAPFTFKTASTAPVDNVNVISGPAGVGRWLRDGAMPGELAGLLTAAGYTNVA